MYHVNYFIDINCSIMDLNVKKGELLCIRSVTVGQDVLLLTLFKHATLSVSYRIIVQLIFRSLL